MPERVILIITLGFVLIGIILSLKELYCFYRAYGKHERCSSCGSVLFKSKGGN